jgi:hypothetical protein
MRTIKTVGELAPSKSADVHSLDGPVMPGMVFYADHLKQHYIAIRAFVDDVNACDHTILLPVEFDLGLSLVGQKLPIKKATIQMVMDTYKVVPIAKLDSYFVKVL